MRSDLPDIALELAVDERTLRRAVERGTLRATRSRPRHLELEPGEVAYLRRQWPLLRALMKALRTEPNVGLAVLFGSKARGDDNEHSDVDLLVAFRRPQLGAAAQLAERTEAALGIHVDVASLDRMREDSPQRLEHALTDGRVLVDRDGRWCELCLEKSSVRRAASRARREVHEAAAEAFATLTQEETGSPAT